MARLFLFDGTGLAYRAYYAIDQSLSTSDGIPTNATYGLMRMMIKFLKERIREGDYAGFAMDKKTRPTVMSCSPNTKRKEPRRRMLCCNSCPT